MRSRSSSTAISSARSSGATIWRRSPSRHCTVPSEPLAAAARAYLENASPGELRGPSIDWARIVDAAERARLAPLLYATARELPLPEPVFARLRSTWLAFGRHHLFGVEQLRSLLAAFDRVSVPVMPLKGPALGEALYRDPGLRPFTDLDLLVRRADVPRAVALLSTLGYRALEHQRPLAYELADATAACFVAVERGSGTLPVDLHWGLVGFPGGIAPRALDTEEVWGRAVTEERWGQQVLALGREDLLLYLALHLAIHHPLDGLAWQLDVALLLRRDGAAMDWERVIGRARRWRVAGAFYFALSRVERCFAACVPPAVLAALRPRSARGALLDRLGVRSDARGRFDHLIPLLLLDRGADLARGLTAGVLPAPSWVRRRYGTGSALSGYVMHYGRLGGIAARMFH